MKVILKILLGYKGVDQSTFYKNKTTYITTDSYKTHIPINVMNLFQNKCSQSDDVSICGILRITMNYGDKAK